MLGQENKHVSVSKDARTLEQRQKDMVSKLRHTVAGPSNRGSNGAANNLPAQMHRHHSDWSNDVNNWIDGMDRTWNAEMRRMRHGLFPLVPVDLFDDGLHELLAPHGDVPSILNRMDRQMDAMRRQMETAMDMNGKQQILGGDNGFHAHEGALVPRGTCGPLDYLKDAYELGEDGRVHFKVRFNVEGYGPEDIKVTTSDHGLTVHAKKSVSTETGSTTREYFRTIYLPPSIEKDDFQGNMTQDGILTLETPVITKSHNVVTFNREHQLAVKPISEMELKKRSPTDDLLELKPIGTHGPTVIMDEKTGEHKLHLEVPIEPDYTADNLCVRMDANRVVVSGRKQYVDETASSKGVHVKEFTRSYEIPETVDTFSINTQLHRNTLLVETPLLHASH
ncbi:Major egg antigen [Paragonimus heterotremus]|uniref:Major egg antigen n=1 Tax=Paragonimus heterotremus TaxID=100268 RepID=A0A8J4SNF1_9TREM|nr:Major egg antigen [Paragonimus heterotremus]